MKRIDHDSKHLDLATCPNKSDRRVCIFLTVVVLSAILIDIVAIFSGLS